MAAREGKAIKTDLSIGNPRISEQVWLSVHAKPVIDEAGERVGSMAVFDDITERFHRRKELVDRHAETAMELTETTKRFDEFLNSVSDVFWSAEISEGNLAFVYFSPTIEDLTGYPPSNFVGDVGNWKAIIHEDDRVRIGNVMKAFVGGESSSVQEEYRIKHSQGHEVWVQNRVRAVPRQRNRIHGVMSNITKRKRSQEALQQNERLASLGTLATGIAHEINNPLGAIMLTSEVAIRRLDKNEPSDNVKDAIQKVMFQVDRCSKIVRNVLRFANNQSSKKAEASISDVVDHACEMMQYKANRERVTFAVENIGENLNAEVNSSELEQVVMNLLSNALDASPEGSHIDVKVESGSEDVVVSVHDNGNGMTEFTRKHAMDPFFTLRREEGGTGLGLSMCHTIMMDHGGTIEVTDSNLLKGAVAIIRIPRLASK